MTFRSSLVIGRVSRPTVAVAMAMNRFPQKLPPFGAGERALASEFGTLASIALENARIHRRARLPVALAQASHAAQELHDTVIQSLFAIGVEADGLVDGPGSGERGAPCSAFRRLPADAIPEDRDNRPRPTPCDWEEYRCRQRRRFRRPAATCGR